MAQHLIACFVSKPEQRHWLGPKNLLLDDTVGLLIVSRQVSEETRINHFWHALMHNPHLDGFHFTTAGG